MSSVGDRRGPCVKCGAHDRRPSGGCRPCMGAREKARNATPEGKARQKAYAATSAAKARAAELRARPQNRRAQKERDLRINYGLPLARFDEMLREQRGRCAACLDEMRPAYVDHDHDTGQVRGLLCARCNTAEGCLVGSPLRAERLAAYLRRHAPKLRIA